MKLSIAMAARNAEDFIGSALTSAQTTLSNCNIDWEITLADGASTDRTLEIAKRCNRVRVVSRADDGLYDGMNRAIAGADGDFIAILNSDDMLLADGFQDAVRLVRDTPGVAMVSGAVSCGPSPETAIIQTHQARLSRAGILFGIPAINGRIFSRELMDAAGALRTDLGLAADREWMLRVHAAGGIGRATPLPLYFYREHTNSRTIAHDAAAALRIYHAEMTLSHALACEHGEDGDLSRLAHGAYALARCKLSLKERYKASSPVKGASAHHGLKTGARDLARGVALWLRWRGRLSGF